MSQGYLHHHYHSKYHLEDSKSMSSIIDDLELNAHRHGSHKSPSKNNHHYYTMRGEDYDQTSYDHNLHHNVHKVPSHNDKYYYPYGHEKLHHDHHPNYKVFGVNHNYHNPTESHKKVHFVEREEVSEVYEEEKTIDFEADDFIKQKHKNFDRCKSY